MNKTKKKQLQIEIPEVLRSRLQEHQLKHKLQGLSIAGDSFRQLKQKQQQQK